MLWHCPTCEAGWEDGSPVSHCWNCGDLGRRGLTPNLCSVHRITQAVQRQGSG